VGRAKRQPKAGIGKSYGLSARQAIRNAVVVVTSQIYDTNADRQNVDEKRFTPAR
jgi:hypothetical protein